MGTRTTAGAADHGSRRASPSRRAAASRCPTRGPRACGCAIIGASPIACPARAAARPRARRAARPHAPLALAGTGRVAGELRLTESSSTRSPLSALPARRTPHALDDRQRPADVPRHPGGADRARQREARRRIELQGSRPMPRCLSAAAFAAARARQVASCSAAVDPTHDAARVAARLGLNQRQ